MENNSYDSETLKYYIQELKTIPILTSEEENQIVYRAVRGDAEAKERLIKGHLRFVISVAKRYRNQGLPLDDLISEGNIGLMQAIEKFDPEKGCRFISYAVWWIKQSIIKAICDKSRFIRLPVNRSYDLMRIEKIRKEVEQKTGEEAGVAEIASALNQKESEISALINITRDHLSFDSSCSDSSTRTLGEMIPDEENSLEREILGNSLKEDINQILGGLNPREAKIIEHRYGLNSRRPKSLKEVGRIFRLSKERIRQIEKQAIETLQRKTQTIQLREYMAS